MKMPAQSTSNRQKGEQGVQGVSNAYRGSKCLMKNYSSLIIQPYALPKHPEHPAWLSTVPLHSPWCLALAPEPATAPI
jgi:hypothetical protein